MSLDEKLRVLRDHGSKLGNVRITFSDGFVVEYGSCFDFKNLSLEPPIISRNTSHSGEHHDCFFFSICQRNIDVSSQMKCSEAPESAYLST